MMKRLSAWLLMLSLALVTTNAIAQETPEGFDHHTVTLESGVKLHFVRGGPEAQQPIFLTHGFPSTWYEWRHVMPLLAESHDVIAVDLRGHGLSTAPLNARFDARSMAEDIASLADELGLESVSIAGHDIGSPVAWMLAADHRELVERLVVIEFVIAGGGLEELIASDPAALWHFPFQQVPDLPERLVVGREAAYMQPFFRPYTYDPSTFSDEDIAYYVRQYQRPGAWRAGFGTYRDLPITSEAVRSHDGNWPSLPVLAIAGAQSLGNPDLGNPAEASVNRVATNARTVVLEQTGHWIMEERPEETARLILEFLAE